MSEEIVIENCSPTLAGLKTGNMFSLELDKEINVIEEVRELNSKLRNKGLRVVPLKKTSEYAIIYVYRPAYLKNDLNHPKARCILKERGYDFNTPEGCLAQLVKHMKEDETFPHEVGLFLGYPPFDVECFMKDPCDGVKCCGCWKAYSNPDEAKEKFIKYKECTEVFRNMNKQGKSLEQLTVIIDEEIAG
ncbi:MAG: DUF3793 family protein [Lachnospiraceae bacterium]|nr:DUF3793 family protein [Lachnospiraceae bacterium]